MRWKYPLFVLGLLLLSVRVYADVSSRLMEQYVRVLQQQDDAVFALLFSPDARATVTLLMGQEEPMVVSLTREEYLQQQRALWNFASDYAFTVNNEDAEKGEDGWQVTFNQKERYKLLQGTLDRDSQMILRIGVHDGKSVITEIHARTRQW